MSETRGDEPRDSYRLLWGKSGPEGAYHPLICHLVDVAEVALVLWRQLLGEASRADLRCFTGLPGAEAARTLAFVVALHDLGKASPEFQRRNADRVAVLQAAGFDFPRRINPDSPGYHGVITARVLPPLLQSLPGMTAKQAQALATAVGGHHGSWPVPSQREALRSWHWGGDTWEQARRRIVADLAGLYHPSALADEAVGPGVGNAALATLSGLTAVADWIGSDENRFPPALAVTDLEAYRAQAQERAAEAVAALGWADWAAGTRSLSFQDLIGQEPWRLQAATERLADTLAGPSLTIIEASTGTGKTEAAYYLADAQMVRDGLRGLYVAMPTMATSNQMHERMTRLLERRYPGVGRRALLVHSRARMDAARALAEPALHDESRDKSGREDEARASSDAQSWFLPRKRSLLAPLAIGTVDQTFLSVLQTRHFFVRLFGLGRKVVIFDEVHAYDTYMSVLFERLLGWLSALGTSVVVLSATLPAETRRRMIAAYAGQETDLPAAPYPAITWWSRGETGVVPLEEPRPRTVHLEWLARSPQALVRALREALAHGGCAAVICNTVQAAQDYYRELSDANVVEADRLWLFHARFPFRRRQEIETAVVQAFGKDGTRPEKAIVVATQVIEQSLDLDFDLMVTELAPIDLLLQRAGRLHRHEGRFRPQPVSAPRLLIGEPEGSRDAPSFGTDAYIYEPYVLLRSLAVLEGREELTTPTDTQGLIEAVYGEEERGGRYADRLAEAREEMKRREEKDAYDARQRLIPAAADPRLLSIPSVGLWEDQPEAHRAVQALTRTGPPSINLVCLHRREGRLYLDEDSDKEVILEEAPDDRLAQELADRSVACSRPAVFAHYVQKEPPRGWRRHPYLRDHRVAEFQDGVALLEGTGVTLHLSTEYGLEVRQEKK